jgi:molybdopterin-binding protein
VASFLGADNVFAGEARPIRAAAPDWTEAGSGERAEFPVAFTTGALTLYALGDAVPGPAHAVIRAEDVMLSLEPVASSVRNQFRGVVLEVVPAGALSKVTIDISGVPLVSAVTTRSVQELGLAPGREVIAAFKATSVHIC